MRTNNPTKHKRKAWQPAQVVETDGDYYYLRVGKKRHELGRDEFNKLVDTQKVIVVRVKP
jgi:hypothetical protein